MTSPDVNLYRPANVLFVVFLHHKIITPPCFLSPPLPSSHTIVFQRKSFSIARIYQRESYASPPYTATFVICSSAWICHKLPLTDEKTRLREIKELAQAT